MPPCVQELHEHGLEFPVLIGGAAINRDFGAALLYPDGRESDDVYEPGVFYCKDAFEGLAKMDQLVDGDEREALVVKTRGPRSACARRAPSPRRCRPTTTRCARRRAPTPRPHAAVWGAPRDRGPHSTRSSPTSTPTCCSSCTGAGAA